MRFVYMWDYQQDIITYSEKNNVDPFLIALRLSRMKVILNIQQYLASVLLVLMQIMPETGRWIAEQMGLEKLP